MFQVLRSKVKNSEDRFLMTQHVGTTYSNTNTSMPFNHFTISLNLTKTKYFNLILPSHLKVNNGYSTIGIYTHVIKALKTMNLKKGYSSLSRCQEEYKIHL